MQLYDIYIWLNYADQLQKALSLRNRKTSMAIMIKFNQSYSIYINIHTLFFSLAPYWLIFNYNKSKAIKTLYILFQIKDHRMKV